MARIRSSKPEWWRKPKWCALARDVRFTYKGIWEVMCDDFGRFVADARLIKGDVWPFDDDITVKRVETWLRELTKVPVTLADGRRVPAIVLYEVDGVRYGYLPGFEKHQKISHKTESKFPKPPGELPEPFRNGSGTSQEKLSRERSGSGAERDLDLDLEAERSGAGGDAAAPRRAAPAAPHSADAAEEQQPPDDRVPADAVDAVDPVELFALWACDHPGATDAKRADVRQQLHDVLTTEGAKLDRRHRRVTATRERLEAKCREVMREGVRDRSKAIVVLLKKLNDTTDVTEDGTQRETVERAADERATEADHAHAAAWIESHPEIAASIDAAVAAMFPDPSNAFATLSATMARRSQTLTAWRNAGAPEVVHA